MDLLDFLKWLKEHVATVEGYNQGICHSLIFYWRSNAEKPHFHKELNRLEYKLETLMARWPKAEWRYAHPVPHPDQQPDWNANQRTDKACEAYDNLPRWQGEYGKLRMELLNWLIKELENGQES